MIWLKHLLQKIVFKRIQREKKVRTWFRNFYMKLYLCVLVCLLVIYTPCVYVIYIFDAEINLYFWCWDMAFKILNIFMKYVSLILLKSKWYKTYSSISYKWKWAPTAEHRGCEPPGPSQRPTWPSGKSTHCSGLGTTDLLCCKMNIGAY